MDKSVQASDNKPIDPITGANPFSEVTDQICRLPLPTLFYRLEAVHLGDLMRTSMNEVLEQQGLNVSVFQTQLKINLIEDLKYRFLSQDLELKKLLIIE
ncbi:hypothetical protein DICVIV_13027 [Dictyocaulus viviparus]|uniref:Uncharacterized protein n=1 Tax=Dictyocaulus viviparus TaxID=29172 RepID=A0A0D8X8U1_DICVI|nr:hypothetical protein DICVIV_13027 [Dictyocaulus viviparus]